MRVAKLAINQGMEVSVSGAAGEGACYSESGLDICVVPRALECSCCHID